MMIEYKSIHTYSINLGRHIGLFRLNYDFNPNNEPITIPCKLKVKWNNVTIETGFIGSSDYDQELVALGYSPTSNNASSSGFLTINKTLEGPGVAEVTLYTPIEESLAKVTLECPVDYVSTNAGLGVLGASFNDYVTSQIISTISGKNSKARYLDGVQEDGLYGLDLFLNYYQNNINSGANDDSELTKNFERNKNCWAYDLDLTCCSPWNMHPTLRLEGGYLTTSSNHTAGVLVSPRHVIFCAHSDFYPPVGSEMRFVAKDNTVVTRTLVSLLEDFGGGAGDITVGLLDEDVPESITFAKVLPDDWETKISKGTIYFNVQKGRYEGGLSPKVLAVGTNQDESVFVSKLDYLNETFFIFKDDETKNFNRDIRLYDSGSPLFIIVDCKPILIFVQTTGTWGTPIVKAKSRINNLMSQLGGNYQLTDANLSKFKNVPTPTPTPTLTPVINPTPTPTPTPLPPPPENFPSILYGCNFYDPDSGNVNYAFNYIGNYVWIDYTYTVSWIYYDSSDSLWKISQNGIQAYYANQLFGQWYVSTGNLIPGQDDLYDGFISIDFCGSDSDSDSDTSTSPTKYEFYQPKIFDIIPINTTSLDQNVASTGREPVKIEDNYKIYIFEKLNNYKSDSGGGHISVQPTIFLLSAKGHNIRGPLIIDFCSGDGDEDNNLFEISAPYYNGFSYTGSTVAILVKEDLIYENKSEYSIRIRAGSCGWDECYYFEKSFKIILVKVNPEDIELKTDMVLLLDNPWSDSLFPLSSNLYAVFNYENSIKKIDAYANMEFASGIGDDDNYRFLISKGMITDFTAGLANFWCNCFTTCYTLTCHNTEGLSDGDIISIRIKLYNQDKSYSNSIGSSCEALLQFNTILIPTQPRAEYTEKILNIPVYQSTSIPRTDNMTDFSLVANTLDASYPGYLYLWIIHPKEYMFLDENTYIRIEYTKNNGLNWNFLIDTYSIGGWHSYNNYSWVFFDLKSQIFYTQYELISSQGSHNSPISYCDTVQFRCSVVYKENQDSDSDSDSDSGEYLSNWTYSNIFSTLSHFGEDCSNQVQSKSLYVSFD